MTGYQEQLNRVRRCFKRFERINESGIFDGSVENHIDDIHAFFQNCYHLKDWLKNDPAFSTRTGPEIENHINTTLELAICADICNSTKHLILTKSPRSGALPTMGKKTFTIGITDTLPIAGEPVKEVPQTISLKIEIDHNGAKLDAFDVATKALQAWEKFI
ncbi:hypothetical protein SAMN05444166_6482 [Singulisphaera sp. GP187]|uniref:hypothetical protein n=1 Tax=Singulisphaera sp. GP187 TaxID=1882752 RepID=UPI00092ABB8D|nr:hypothetical protein [Singulisphaera sp. GP187]SIO60674.1 hypothetical protein SAMN05444166_6482 [Singulisphaera sp. GP187]